MTEAKLAKLEKKLGQMTLDTLNAMSTEELNSRIVEASKAMEQVKNELEANPKYQALKDDLAALTQSKKDVDARQKAIITYCVHLLDEKGTA